MQTKQSETHVPKLVVMLTKDDFTVKNALEIFESCSDSLAECWGFKEKPLPLDEMKVIYKRMKECGKTTFLEVVAYDEIAGLDGARVAYECKCDVMMGSKFYPAVARFCNDKGIKYMPFVGDTVGRPTILKGTIEGIMEEARDAVMNGAYGVDLLGYRFEGDKVALCKAVVENTPAPVCIAGSINSYSRLDEIKKISPWAFTIGSAFFHNEFEGTFAEQINKVVKYLQN